MITATITISEQTGTIGSDLHVMATRHAFEYQTTRSGGVVPELDDLIEFLGKLRAGNGGIPEPKESVVSECTDGLVRRMYYLLKGSLPIGTRTMTAIQKLNLTSGLKLLEQLIEQSYPKVQEGIDAADVDG